MTKEEAKQKLKKKGYKVSEDNSVVTVLVAPGVSMKNTIKDVKEKLSVWGYESSFSVRQSKGAENTEEIAEESADESVADAYEPDADAGALKEAVKESGTTKEKQGKEYEVVKSAAAKASEEVPKTAAAKASKEVPTTEDEYFDEEDSDMLLTESSIQFSLEDFGLDF